MLATGAARHATHSQLRCAGGRLVPVKRAAAKQDIAMILGVSQQRLAAALSGLGLERGAWARLVCPLNAGELRGLVAHGETAGSLARRYAVSWSTAGRWLGELALLPADSGIDPVRLGQLYVEQMGTTREVAAEPGVDKGRVLRALVAAVSRSGRKPTVDPQAAGWR